MSAPHVCPYCGLTTRPLSYHEDYKDCQADMRKFTKGIKEFLSHVSPFCSAWELDPYSTDIDGEQVFNAIAFKVGYGPQFEEDNKS